MADVMEERIRSGLTAGISFALGALLIAVCIMLFLELPPANETNRILEVLVRQDNAGWMWLHAALAAGFVLATIGFVSLGFMLHFEGATDRPRPAWRAR